MNPLAYRLLVMADSRRWIEVAVLNSRQAAVRKLRELRTEDARLQRRRNLHAVRRRARWNAVRTWAVGFLGGVIFIAICVATDSIR